MQVKSPTVIDEILSRKSGSHQTPRWREKDSNPRSPVRRMYETPRSQRNARNGGADRREKSAQSALGTISRSYTRISSFGITNVRSSKNLSTLNLCESRIFFLPLLF